MKSTYTQLLERGYLPKYFDLEPYDLSLDEKLELLKSKTPRERSIAARLLSYEFEPESAIEPLVAALAKEKKLYPKIEITNTLVFHRELSVKPLIEILGKIGNNQHKKVPDSTFNKKSYPLPRDIAARTLGQIGKPALPDLLGNIDSFTTKQLSEAIDAIGFICFYERSPYAYPILLKCYKQNSTNDLLKWKIIRAFSAFPEGIEFLMKEQKKETNNRLKKEIERSIALAKDKNIFRK